MATLDKLPIEGMVKIEPIDPAEMQEMQQPFEENISNMEKRLIEHDESQSDSSPSESKKKKQHTCKKCGFVAKAKVEFWRHLRTHIPPDKILECHLCEFVTEFKHHLEYHIKNHAGIKPFKCEDCDYSCNNKSMLNSHKKSHSNVYQYRCVDCSYASKYCHQLKLHLRRYGHKPAMVLNPDGTPNPLPIVDVYGSKRGPKIKPIEQQPRPHYANIAPVLPPTQLPIQFNVNPMLYPIVQAYVQRLTEIRMSLANQYIEPSSSPEPEQNIYEDTPEVSPDGALDLTLPQKRITTSPFSGSTSSMSPHSSSGSERSYSNNSPNRFEVNNNSNKNQHEEHLRSTPKSFKHENEDGQRFRCVHCDIEYPDFIMYSLHMRYHDSVNPFTCRMCGVICNDKISFSVHLAKDEH